MIGKPYSGKPNVRFDEGVLKIGYGWASEALPDERGRNGYAQPEATTSGLYSKHAHTSIKKTENF